MADETVEPVAAEDYQAYKASRMAQPEPVVVAEEAPAAPVAEEAQAVGKESVTPVESPAEAEEKKKGGWQRKIEKLERERDELRQKISESQKPVAPVAEQVKAKTEDGRPERPTPDKFDSWEKFEEAKEDFLEKLQDWKIDQREKSQRKAYEEAQIKQHQANSEKAWMERLTAAKGRIKDFDEVVGNATAENDVQVSPAMSQAIVESEHGPDVVYYLAKNPAEAIRISKLSPLAAAREIGKIEAKVAPDAEPEKPAKTVSKAPPPIKPVGSTASTVKTLDDAGDDYQKFKASRLKGAK